MQGVVGSDNCRARQAIVTWRAKWLRTVRPAPLDGTSPCPLQTFARLIGQGNGEEKDGQLAHVCAFVDECAFFYVRTPTIFHQPVCQCRSSTDAHTLTAVFSPEKEKSQERCVRRGTFRSSPNRHGSPSLARASKAGPPPSSANMRATLSNASPGASSRQVPRRRYWPNRVATSRIQWPPDARSTRQGKLRARNQPPGTGVMSQDTFAN